MFDIETLKIIKDLGYGLASLAFSFWLIREIVLRMGKSMDMLVVSIQSLQNRIESWNKEQEQAHGFQKQEHEKILERLTK